MDILEFSYSFGYSLIYIPEDAQTPRVSADQEPENWPPAMADREVQENVNY